MVLLSAVMDLLDEHVSVMQAGAASNGQSRSRNTIAKPWNDYKPVCENGVVDRVECRYCHVRLNRRSDSLDQHQEICPGKERLGTGQQQQDAEFQYGMLLNLNSHSCKLRSFLMIYLYFVSFGENFYNFPLHSQLVWRL